MDWRDYTSAVVAFFTTIAEAYTSTPVDVEVLAMNYNDIQTTATVGKDVSAGCFRVFVDGRMTGVDLLATLFHELRHCMVGGVNDWEPWRVDLVRDVLLGARGGAAEVKRRAFLRSAAEYDAGQRDPVEDDIDAWAIEQALRWWPVLEQTVTATVARVNHVFKG